MTSFRARILKGLIKGFVSNWDANMVSSDEITWVGMGQNIINASLTCKLQTMSDSEKHIDY